jgi:zinc D-Ala-D-Ala carboxypeptidase
MTYPEPGRTTRRLPTILVAGLLVVVVAIGAMVGLPFGSSAFSPAPSSPPRPSLPSPASSTRAPSSPPRASTIESLGSGQRGALGEADGVLPDRVTVFDEEYPGTANLDPALLGALRRAATDAARDGVEFHVDSGWRSWNYQAQLFRQAVSKYGSKAKAARWVAMPGTSSHESGDAVDLGPVGATWLSEHGARYGLCQIYSNEPWHYELRPVAINRGCPRMYADPAQDPRLQR